MDTLCTCRVVNLILWDAGDTGWEIFSLDYAIDAPIAAVVIDLLMRQQIADGVIGPHERHF